MIYWRIPRQQILVICWLMIAAVSPMAQGAETAQFWGQAPFCSDSFEQPVSGKRVPVPIFE